MNSTKQISGTNIDSFCANDVPTPCFYESEGVANCHPLVGIFASDSATPKISSSAVYNLTCSFYGAPDGQCSCLMDDPEVSLRAKYVPLFPLCARKALIRSLV